MGMDDGGGEGERVEARAHGLEGGGLVSSCCAGHSMATTIGLLNLSTSRTSWRTPQTRSHDDNSTVVKEKTRKKNKRATKTWHWCRRLTRDGQPDRHAGISSESPVIVTPPNSPGQLPIPGLQSSVIHIKIHLLQSTQYRRDRDLFAMSTHNTAQDSTHSCSEHRHRLSCHLVPGLPEHAPRSL